MDSETTRIRPTETYRVSEDCREERNDLEKGPVWNLVLQHGLMALVSDMVRVSKNRRQAKTQPMRGMGENTERNPLQATGH
jgi:hypothetical protein